MKIHIQRPLVVAIDSRNFIIYIKGSRELVTALYFCLHLSFNHHLPLCLQQ